MENFANLVTPRTESFTVQANRLDRAIVQELKFMPKRDRTPAVIHVFICSYMDHNDTSEIGNFADILEWVRKELR